MKRCAFIPGWFERVELKDLPTRRLLTDSISYLIFPKIRLSKSGNLFERGNKSKLSLTRRNNPQGSKTLKKCSSERVSASNDAPTGMLETAPVELLNFKLKHEWWNTESVHHTCETQIAITDMAALHVLALWRHFSSSRFGIRSQERVKFALQEHYRQRRPFKRTESSAPIWWISRVLCSSSAWDMSHTFLRTLKTGKISDTKNWAGLPFCEDL